MMNHKNMTLNHSGNMEVLGLNYYDLMFHKGLVKNAMAEDAAHVLSSDIDTTGGYLVPDTMEKQIVHALAENNVVRRLATVIHTESGDHLIPIVNTMSDAQWLAENADIQLASADYCKLRFRHHKLALMIRVSNELLNDAGMDMLTFFADTFAEQIASAEENAFINGDGGTMPQGLLSADAATVGVNAASPTSITAEEILALYSSLDETYRQKAVFMMHEDTANALRLLKDENGHYLWREALGADQPNMMLGRPVYISRFMPKMAAGAKPILFGDLSKYWIADRGNRRLSRFNELYAKVGQVGFRMTERVDGKLLLPEAVKVIQMAE